MTGPQLVSLRSLRQDDKDNLHICLQHVQTYNLWTSQHISTRLNLVFVEPLPVVLWRGQGILQIPWEGQWKGWGSRHHHPSQRHRGPWGGHGRTWEDMGGHGRTWEDHEDHGGLWRPCEGKQAIMPYHTATRCHRWAGNGKMSKVLSRRK